MDHAPDLELNQDVRFQRREWKAERLGWAALFLLVTASVIGLFGHGPVSWTSATSDDGTLEASFERFGRRGGTQALVVRADASTADGGVWELDISDDYAGGVQFTSITPQPDSAERIPDGIRYTFTQAEAGASLEVTFDVTPDSLWGLTGDLRLAGQDPLTVEQFFFP